MSVGASALASCGLVHRKTIAVMEGAVTLSIFTLASQPDIGLRSLEPVRMLDDGCSTIQEQQ